MEGTSNLSFKTELMIIYRATPSGSQTMAYVMALQQGWPTNELKFKSQAPNNDLTAAD